MLAPSTPSPLSLALEPDAFPSRRKRRRFTLDGSDALEQHLGRSCASALAGTERIVGPRNLEALLLGGGYGRGEGGVLKTEDGERPYNDLEFYVFVAGNRLRNQRRHGAALHALARTLASSAGVDVEFKITSMAHWRRCAISMFSYDLMLGHHSLGRGPAEFTDCEHHFQAQNIPLAEATRLLMNRFSGLLFAQEKLAARPFTVEASDFVERNLAKAQLALGDAVLAARGQYHWSCLERQERLQRTIFGELLPWRTALLGHHAAGMEFKLHPRRTEAAPAVLQARLNGLIFLGLRLWLWLEGRRLGVAFQTARDYCISRIDKCPETLRWRNVLVNGYVLFPERFILSRCWRHPRERVLTALAWLLWEQPSTEDEEAIRQLQFELSSHARTPAGLTSAYRSLWQHFS